MGYTSKDYANEADSAVALILKAIPGNPEILRMDSAWDIFKVEDLKRPIGDMGLSLYQAMWALRKAQQTYAEDRHE